MKVAFVTILMVLSQFATAKIADFNSLIKEHSKLQNELHESISADTSEAVENSGAEMEKKPEIIVVDMNREVYSQAKIPKKNAKKTSIKKKYNKADDIEEKHFLRLGEELNSAN